MKCCGVTDNTDFTGATQWTTVYPNYTLKTPLSCCKSLPSSTDFTCAATPTDSNNNWKTVSQILPLSLTPSRERKLRHILRLTTQASLRIYIHGSETIVKIIVFLVLNLRIKC